jgi:hypothetical protein
MSSITDFRAEKDDFFKNHPQSPLTAAQKRSFTGLQYFPEAPSLRLILPVEVFPEQKKVEIQTSGGVPQEYRRYGQVHFKLEGQDVTLTLYASGGSYFLPFADSLAGVETYPAGRYLEPEALEDGQFELDFNTAYNPYCAYNDRWSCPLTPAENRLKVPVRAGEKVFHS